MRRELTTEERSEKRERWRKEDTIIVLKHNDEWGKGCWLKKKKRKETSCWFISQWQKAMKGIQRVFM